MMTRMVRAWRSLTGRANDPRSPFPREDHWRPDTKTATAISDAQRFRTEMDRQTGVLRRELASVRLDQMRVREGIRVNGLRDRIVIEKKGNDE
ncbi:MAG: hypothetical protein ACR2M1_12420 [Gemmatimonadaceae bacterium]